jgi:hypothetical protein
MNRFSEGTREAIRTPPEQRTPYQSLLAFQGMPQITYKDEKLASRPQRRREEALRRTGGATEAVR